MYIHFAEQNNLFLKKWEVYLQCNEMYIQTDYKPQKDRTYLLVNYITDQAVSINLGAQCNPKTGSYQPCSQPWNKTAGRFMQIEILKLYLKQNIHQTRNKNKAFFKLEEMYWIQNLTTVCFCF